MSEPAKKQSNPLFLLVVVVLVAALGAEAYLLTRPRRAVLGAEAAQRRTAGATAAGARPTEATQAIASGPDQIEYFGDKSAPIKIEFYAPLALEWHQKTIGLLRDYVKKHPNRISVELMPMGNGECDEEMVKRGFTCAVIFINGKHEFTLPDGKKVDLQKKPNAGDQSFYNSEDVITIIDGMK
jgi:hypothetical protein